MSESSPCLACEAPNPIDANFCEACGHDLSIIPPPRCVSCGGEVSIDDGYCNSCGQKQPAERDHQVVVDGSVVAGSDRGLRHHHNEDAFAIAELDSGWAVLVVCDGVSSTPGSADASQQAALAARETLVACLADEAEPSEQSRQRALVLAAAAAQGEAAAVPEGPTSDVWLAGGPPSSTFVAAVAGRVGDSWALSVAWIGDSRAYWVGDNPELLTNDHEIDGSLARWIGADSPGGDPETVHRTMTSPGRVLLCSDGLWRYAAEASEMAKLVSELVDGGASGPDLVEGLLAAANEGGGHDNISVALWPEPPAQEEQQQSQLPEEGENQ